MYVSYQSWIPWFIFSSFFNNIGKKTPNSKDWERKKQLARMRKRECFDQINPVVSRAGKRWPNNCEKEKVQLSSFDSFKLWGLLDNNSNIVQLAPALYTVFHSSRLCQESWPCGRGETWKSKWHFRMKSSPHTVLQLTSTHAEFCDTKVQSSGGWWQLSRSAPSDAVLSSPLLPLSTTDGKRNYFR